jgi:hypothetical protein
MTIPVSTRQRRALRLTLSAVAVALVAVLVVGGQVLSVL